MLHRVGFEQQSLSSRVEMGHFDSVAPFLNLNSPLNGLNFDDDDQLQLAMHFLTQYSPSPEDKITQILGE